MYFIGSTLGRGSSGILGQGETYFPFALAGIAFSDAFTSGLTAFPHAVRDGQMAGTLEPLLLAPVRMSQLILASSAFHFVQSFLRSILVLAIGAFAFGFWHRTNLLTATLIFVPGCLVFAALGLLSASFVLAFKQGDPVAVAYVALNGILGGAVFPVAVLPAWLQPLAATLPLTHALSGMRLALAGAAPTDVLSQLIVLWTLAAALLPIGFGSFQLALIRAKKEGSLVQY
jgi:ABC-2 type transport system permease protein